MVKTRISAKRRRFSRQMSRTEKRRILKLKDNARIRESNPMEEILNEELIGRAMWDCLKEGDSEGMVKVIRIYLEASNKTHLAEQAEVARSTVYQLKGGNPTVKTLAKLVHANA